MNEIMLWQAQLALLFSWYAVLQIYEKVQMKIYFF